jgi:hypothetical protein
LRPSKHSGVQYCDGVTPICHTHSPWKLEGNARLMFLADGTTSSK